MPVVRPLTFVALLGGAVIVSGCEPASVTEAREQLGRGPARTLLLTVPVALDTLEPRELVGAGRDTVVDELVAAKLDVESFTVPLAGLQVAPVTFEVSDQIPVTALDFDELEDAVRGSTLNAAQLGLKARNTSAAPLSLSNGTVGLVELDAMGNIPRDPLGNPQYETDAGGNPILVPVTDPGQTTLSVNPNDSTEVVLLAGAFGDRLVHMVLDGRNTAAVAEGTVSLGPGGSPTDVGLNDVLLFDVTPVVQLDLTIPDTGVVVRINTLREGLDLDTADADDVVSRLVSASISSRVLSRIPFAVELDMAYAPGDRGDLTDIFSLPDAVVLNRIAVTAPAVNAAGRTSGAVTDTVSIGLTGADVRPLLGPDFTAGLRARLLPSAAGATRGAVAATDLLELLASVRIEARTGGSP